MHPWLAVYLKGVCMGAADIIPGVSGGTIALIVGIYDRLVTAIASLDPRVLHHLRHPGQQTHRQAFLDDLRAMDLPFLLVLGAGIGTAFIVISRVILIVFETYPAYVNAFFFGLIAASAVIIYRDVRVGTPGRIGVAIVGFSLAFVVSGLAAGGDGGTLPIVFGAGMIAISAMILPGISGAAFLYILGQYEFLLDALRTTVDGLVAINLTDDVVDAGVVVGTFLIGALIGLLTTAHIVSWALTHYRQATLVFLVSLMVGALRLPIEEVHGFVGIPGPLEAGGLLLTAAIGILAVWLLDRATGSLEYA